MWSILDAAQFKTAFENARENNVKLSPNAPNADDKDVEEEDEKEDEEHKEDEAKDE